MADTIVRATSSGGGARRSMASRPAMARRYAVRWGRSPADHLAEPAAAELVQQVVDIQAERPHRSTWAAPAGWSTADSVVRPAGTERVVTRTAATPIITLGASEPTADRPDSGALTF